MDIVGLTLGALAVLPFLILIIGSILEDLPPTRFNSHLNCLWYGREIITPEHEVFMDYDKWFTLYNGDPAHWDLDSYFPVYSLNYNEWYVVRFRDKRDFKKWQKFVKTSKEKGEDYENLKDLEKLTALVKTENEKTIQQRREELNKLYLDYEANLLATMNRTKEEAERKEQMQIGSH